MLFPVPFRYLCAVNYLSVEELSKSYNEKLLFENISFGIARGEKVALVARNGAGKTTLLNILTGSETPEKGVVSFRKEISVEYLGQDPRLNENATVLENIFIGDSPVLKAVREYERISMLAEPSDKDLSSLEKVSEALTQLDGWDYESRAHTILGKLGITDATVKAGHLSGGQKKRVALAKVLISEPDFLILDEPTNHLDLDMIEWLEEFLGNRNLTLLIVTHDRYFLDRVCDRILEMENGKLYTHKGNFSYFVEQKALREMAEASELEKDRNIYRRELEWVRRMPKARTTKSKSRTEAFDRLDDKLSGRRTTEQLEIAVKTERLGGKILELVNITKSFGEKKLFENFSYVLKRGEKVGIIGKNGAGKSTLLNMIMGLEKPDAGKIIKGETVNFGYFSQEGHVFDPTKRVIEVVRDIAEFIPMANGTKLSASQLLLKFQFSAEVQYNMVAKLSGGEKRRLYLMTLLIRNPNFLILDEPTNDLDIATLTVLEDFLQSFSGCLLIVSHDRYFMDKLVDHVFALQGDGKVKDFPGNYTDFRIWADAQELLQVPAKKEKTTAAKEKTPSEKKPEPRSETAPKKKAGFKEKFEYEQLEKEIPLLESKKKDLEDSLSRSLPYDEISRISKELESLNGQLEEKGLRWLELSELM